MGRHKGEMTSACIDRGWPHQVALEARLSMGERYFTVHSFCKDLSFCLRGHSFYCGGRDFNVYCFADRAHAERFRARFGGELVDADEHPRWWHRAQGAKDLGQVLQKKPSQA